MHLIVSAEIVAFRYRPSVEDQEVRAVKRAPVYLDLRAGDSVEEEDSTSLVAREAAACPFFRLVVFLSFQT